MSVIYVLIPIAVLLTALGIYLFFWAVKTEQFDDLEKQGLSILFDDENNAGNKTKDDQENTTQASSQQLSSEQEAASKNDNNRTPE